MDNYSADTLDAGPYYMDAQETMMSVKGDWKRPCCTTRQEQDLRERYARTDMTRAQFDRAYNKLEKQGLIQRNGRILK